MAIVLTVVGTILGVNRKSPSEIKIQYANTLDDYKVGGFHEDTFADEDASSIVGTTTGASAYFTDPADRVRKLETFADNTQDYKFEVNATSTAKIHICWLVPSY